MPNWGQGAQGAAGGAMTGAAMGSALGPWGTAAGAVIGGIGGGLMGLDDDTQKQQDDWRKRLEAYYNAQGGPAPQMGSAAQASASDFRGNQQALISRLEAMSRGQGPSLAAEQMKAATDRSQSQQAAFANSGRGGAMGAQNAANNSALLGANASQQSMQGRIQEQYNAMNQLGLTLHGARGADESLSQFNAGEQNRNAYGNLQARLDSMNLDARTRMELLQLMGGGLPKGPGVGSQMLAGGAGAFAQAAGSGAFKSAPGTPSAGSYADQGRSQWGNRIVDPWA